MSCFVVDQFAKPFVAANLARECDSWLQCFEVGRSIDANRHKELNGAAMFFDAGLKDRVVFNYRRFAIGFERSSSGEFLVVFHNDFAGRKWLLLI